MKEYILLAINIVFTIGLFIYAYDPKQEYVLVGTQIECMNIGQSKSLCAQCFTRSVFVDPYKGYVINSTEQYAGLKFPYKQAQLSCQESLHLVDYSDINSVSIVFERQQIIGQLLSELDASVILSKKGKSTVEPHFESFIIFGWYNTNLKKGADILMPNQNVNKSFYKLFFKILNVFIIILIIGKFMLANEKQKKENPVVNYLIIILIVVLELLTSSYAQDYFHLLLYFVRIVSLVLPVMRVQVRTTYVLIYTLLGFLMAWNQLTLAVYSYLGWLLILIGGWDKLNVEPIWRYAMISQLILSVNYLFWYLLFNYEADSALRIIELSQLLVSLLAVSLLPNRNVQRFRQYIPSDQKPIYLSGYDEEEEMVVRT